MAVASRLRIVLAASLLVLPPFVSTGSAWDCVVECMERSGCWSGGSVSDPGRCNNMPELCNIQCRNQHRDSWGAIAYSVKDKGFGYSDGRPDVRDPGFAVLAVDVVSVFSST